MNSEGILFSLLKKVVTLLLLSWLPRRKLTLRTRRSLLSDCIHQTFVETLLTAYPFLFSCNIVVRIRTQPHFICIASRLEVILLPHFPYSPFIMQYLYFLLLLFLHTWKGNLHRAQLRYLNVMREVISEPFILWTWSKILKFKYKYAHNAQQWGNKNDIYVSSILYKVIV